MAVVPSIGRASRLERTAPPEAERTRDLYERYAGQIFTYCLHQLGSREEAEDAVQSTFLNAFRGLKRGVVPELESAWLFKIAQNVCLSRRRSSWRRGRIESPADFDVVEELAPAPSRRGDELIGLQDVLERMPEGQRRAILLREWQGLSYREIADELEVSQAAVETLIFRARRTLAQGLEQPPERRRGRIRRGSDLGNLLAGLKSFLLGGGAAAKVAATVAVVSATTVVAAAPVQQHRPPAMPVPASPPAPASHVSRPAATLHAAAPPVTRGVAPRHEVSSSPAEPRRPSFGESAPALAPAALDAATAPVATVPAEPTPGPPAAVAPPAALAPHETAAATEGANHSAGQPAGQAQTGQSGHDGGPSSHDGGSSSHDGGSSSHDGGSSAPRSDHGSQAAEHGSSSGHAQSEHATPPGRGGEAQQGGDPPGQSKAQGSSPATTPPVKVDPTEVAPTTPTPSDTAQATTAETTTTTSTVTTATTTTVTTTSPTVAPPAPSEAPGKGHSGSDARHAGGNG